MELYSISSQMLPSQRHSRPYVHFQAFHVSTFQHSMFPYLGLACFHFSAWHVSFADCDLPHCSKRFSQGAHSPSHTEGTYQHQPVCYQQTLTDWFRHSLYIDDTWHGLPIWLRMRQVAWLFLLFTQANSYSVTSPPNFPAYVFNGAGQGDFVDTARIIYDRTTVLSVV